MLSSLSPTPWRYLSCHQRYLLPSLPPQLACSLQDIFRSTDWVANQGYNYYPLFIKGEDGQLHTACYMSYLMDDNPQVLGRMELDGSTYGEALITQPKLELGPPTGYACAALELFTADYPDVTRVDGALANLHDQSLIAEVL